MKVHKWLSRQGSAIIASALVELAPGEVADVEAMLKLLDGDSAGHYGLKATLVSVDKEPRTRKAKNGAIVPDPQFGMPNASTLRASKRYYHVVVDRD